MEIAVDMENVLADPKSWFLEVYNRRHGTNYAIEDVDHWDWVRTEIEFQEFMDTIDAGWRHHRDQIDPLARNLDETLDRLARSTGATIDIVTARTGVESEMQAWLADHGVTTYEAFISIEPSDTKAQLGYDYYIDDSPRLATNLRDTQTQFLVEWPWNRDARELPRTVPVTGIEEAVDPITRGVEKIS